ncbi:MAG: hypothetical protein ACC726_05480 [Chloroflexota bacterium]
MSHSAPTTGQRLLLAGSMGPERVPARPDPEDSRWYEPLHVRDEAAARERIAAQVVSGADVVMAPAWLTHRRALLPLGETRRARDWTAAAVRVARDGVEVGLERREEAARREADAETGAQIDADMAALRPTPLIAAPLPNLAGEQEPDEGRLLPRDAATERDYRDQAGLIADAEPDLILVEGTGGRAEADLAVAEATATGLPAWAVFATSSGRETDHDAALALWAETSRLAGAEALLLGTLRDSSAQIAAEAGLPWGALLPRAAAMAAQNSDDQTRRWLEQGATILGILDGASPPAIAEVRDAMDGHGRADLAERAAVQAGWSLHVNRAARMAPGGAALWLGIGPAAPLPGGFEWLVIDPAETRHLPHEHFRLIVAADTESADARSLAPLLQDGGILALRHAPLLRDIAGLRLLSLDADSHPPLALFRRER